MQNRVHKRLISTSCLLFKRRGKASKSCAYSYVLFQNRESKRKAKGPTCVPPKKCNYRFLGESGLKTTITNQQSNFKKELEKDFRAKDLEMMHPKKTHPIS